MTGAPTALPWLLGGPPLGTGPEPLQSHTARLGPCPPGGPEMISVLRESRLRGRGGAAFPTARKWGAVAERARGQAAVLVNGAEGEPASWKDRILMSTRPHLVLDGAVLAAQSVGAAAVVLYVNGEFEDARRGLDAAIAERRRAQMRLPPVRFVSAPPRYVAGEESAAVRRVNGGPAQPAFVPPRPYQAGIAGRPTLVQNVETLVDAALIARFGPRWFRDAGSPACPGSVLLTIRGAVARPGVYEVAQGTGLEDAVRMAGGEAADAPGVLLGGYFGGWVAGPAVRSLRLEDEVLRALGMTLGCGVVFLLPDGACPVVETARALEFLAGESARQCGPCESGLGTLAYVARGIAAGTARPEDRRHLARWAGQLAHGRGACRHPDGAAGLLLSALRTFPEHFRSHAPGRCPAASRAACLPMPPPSAGWR